MFCPLCLDFRPLLFAIAVYRCRCSCRRKLRKRLTVHTHALKKDAEDADTYLARGDNAIITMCMDSSILCPQSPQPITWTRAGWETIGLLPGLALKTILFIMFWKNCSVKKKNKKNSGAALILHVWLTIKCALLSDVIHMKVFYTGHIRSTWGKEIENKKYHFFKLLWTYILSAWCFK